MTRTKSSIGISVITLFGAALVGVACSSTDPAPSGSAGSPGSGGNGTAGAPVSAGQAGMAGAPRSAGRPTSGAGGSAGAAGANSCTPLPTSLLLTDFSPATLKGVVDGSSWSTSRVNLWGNASSLNGGDGFYQGTPASAPKVTLHDQTLTLSATIAAGDYVGYIFNFAPQCTNASVTQGLQFDVLPGSTLGNATLEVQMQQKSDYPSTANPSTRPGDCEPRSAATQYDDCFNPATTVASSGSTLNAGTTTLPWSSFGGGLPVSTLDNSQLMAIQWQFECPPDGGTISSSVPGSGSGGAAGAGVNGSAGGAGGSGASAGGASAGAAAGSSGASARTSGTAGSSSTAGSSGTGSSGESAGTSGAAGASGAAGTSGAAGAGGSASTTPPCVVSFTFDNVTFY